MTAYHEVGHALICHLLENTDPLHKVTIIPRGFALGLTMSLPEEDVVSMTKAQIIDRICFCLGGRLAEEIVYGDDKITTGAQNDLEKSTKLARRMVTEFGMSERLGPMTFGKRNEHVFLGKDFGHERDYSESVAQVIDEEVTRIITDQYERVKQILLSKRKHMDAIVKVLLEKETLDGTEFAAIVKRVDDGGPEPPPDEPLGSSPVAEKAEEPAATPVDIAPEPPPEFRPKFA